MVRKTTPCLCSQIIVEGKIENMTPFAEVEEEEEEVMKPVFTRRTSPSRIPDSQEVFDAKKKRLDICQQALEARGYLQRSSPEAKWIHSSG